MWFGTPGNLVELPDPQPDIDGSPQVASSTQMSLGGRRTVQKFGSPHRDFVVQWEWLTEDEASILTGFSQGANGPGPFVIIEALDTNMLTPNQASGTDVKRDTSGFFLDPTQGTLSSSTAGKTQGLRSLRWDFPSSGATIGAVYVNASNVAQQDSFALPVIEGEPYTFCADISGNDTAIEMNLHIDWYDADGVFVDDVSWADVNAGSSLSVFQRLQVTGDAPVGAAYAAPRINVTNIVYSKSLLIDSLQFERSEQATDWKPGLGIPKVSVPIVPRQYPIKGWHTHGPVTFIGVGGY